MGNVDGYLAKNLRLLCSYHDFVAEVARKLGMNRQQIMKYLSGASHPSARSLRRLCDFFGVEEYEIVMPDDQFRDVVRLRPSLPASPGLTPALVSMLFKGAAVPTSQLRPYEGYYYEFRYSFTSPEFILKSLIHIYERDGVMMYKSIERLKRPHAFSGTGSVDAFKYSGILLMIGNRIHMIDHERTLGQELSHMVLFPPYRSSIAALRGMKMGVTATDAHEPIACRVVLEKIGRRINLRRGISLCGLYPPDSENVPRSTLAYLGRRSDHRPVMFSAAADPTDPGVPA